MDSNQSVLSKSIEWLKENIWLLSGVFFLLHLIPIYLGMLYLRIFDAGELGFLTIGFLPIDMITLLVFSIVFTIVSLVFTIIPLIIGVGVLVVIGVVAFSYYR